MEKLTQLTSRVVRLAEDDIDTDVIFPARFLLITDRQGLGRHAFQDRRAGPGGADFPLRPNLDDPPRILVAGRNFGCGSSREQAVWALQDLGLRCLLAPGFGEIFQSNCFRNGLLPITLAAAVLDTLASGTVLTIDLVETMIFRPDGSAIPFAVPEWRREALLNGWDEVLTLVHGKAEAIGRFEASRRAAAPWLFPSA
jgi:3-isopropylmalate dehydratase small subunit